MEKDFDTIEKGYYGGHKPKAEYVIKDEKEWEKIWNSTYSICTPKPDAPTIDFSKDMVIAVYQGEFNTGGYGIEIKQITEGSNSLEVIVEETFPGPNDMVTMAFSQPYHIVKTEKSDKNVTFKGVCKRTI